MVGTPVRNDTIARPGRQHRTSQAAEDYLQLRSLLWICLVLLPAQVFAQGSVTGTVRDAAGAALPGVTVELAVMEPGAKPLRTAVTNATGRYEIRDVLPGTYALAFRLPGFSTLSRDGVAVVQGAPIAVDAVLRVGRVVETFPYRRPTLPPGQQSRQRNCLHGDTETEMEYQRRSDALDAMRMIDFVISWTIRRPHVRMPTWDDLATSPVVASLRGMRGLESDNLARKIAWGESTPLPGWSIDYVATATDVRFALTDLRDPCGFTYSSQDPNVIPRSFGILPLQEN